MRKMEIEDFEIRIWTKEFNEVREIAKTSASVWKWCEPTQRILNILPPVVGGYYLSTFILREDKYNKPAMILGYFRRPLGSDCLMHNNKSYCCDLIDSERMEARFLQLAKDLKCSFHLRASKKLAQAFLDNVYTSESDNQSSPSGIKKD